MAYNQFSLSDLQRLFDLTIRDGKDWLKPVGVLKPSDLLTQYLSAYLDTALEIGTEKARSEIIVTPILLEIKRALNISLFSGIEFNVSPEVGLVGYCDYLLSLSQQNFFLDVPVVVIVEAKKADLNSGLGQCLAEMIAAQRFNEERGKSLPAIYGAITTGSAWKFLRLMGKMVDIDPTEYPIEPLERILGFFMQMVSPANN